MEKNRLIKLAGIVKESMEQVNEATESKGFEKSKESMVNMISLYKQSQRLRNSIKREFESESSKYKSGKWDIIRVGQPKTNNFYNAKIIDIWSEKFIYDKKTGEPSLTIGFRVKADNMNGEGYCGLNNLSIVPGYTSEEGMAYKNRKGR